MLIRQICVNIINICVICSTVFWTRPHQIKCNIFVYSTKTKMNFKGSSYVSLSIYMHCELNLELAFLKIWNATSRRGLYFLGHKHSPMKLLKLLFVDQSKKPMSIQGDDEKSYLYMEFSLSPRIQIILFFY